MSGTRTSIEAILQPVPGKEKCGEDIWFSESRYQLLLPIEQAWRDGEEPSWSEIERVAYEHLMRSRDLRTAVIHCLARLKTNGLAGFCDGLGLIHRLMDKFGDQVHPLPETADDDIRLNALSNLSAPLGNDTPYQFVKYLREIPLCRSAGGTHYSLADAVRAERGGREGEDVGRPASALIEATFRAAPREQLAEVGLHLGEALEHIDRIEAISAGTHERARGVSLDALRAVLAEMKQWIESFAEPSEAAVEAGQLQGASPNTDGIAEMAVAVGGIRTRTDADAALAAVCEYLRRNEPSSPVPLLVERARRLLRMDFLESMRDLAPEALERFENLFGLTQKESS